MVVNGDIGFVIELTKFDLKLVFSFHFIISLFENLIIYNICTHMCVYIYKYLRRY